MFVCRLKFSNLFRSCDLSLIFSACVNSRAEKREIIGHTQGSKSFRQRIFNEVNPSYFRIKRSMAIPEGDSTCGVFVTPPHTHMSL